MTRARSSWSACVTLTLRAQQQPPHTFSSTTTTTTSMSFRDPYYQPQHYQQPYTDVPDFDPYGNRQPPHPTYDQSGYRDTDDHDEPGFPSAGQTAVEHDQGAGVGSREKSKYEEMFPPVFRPPE